MESAGYPTGIATGDFNGDGRLDIAYANPQASQVMVLLNQGNFLFSQPVPLPAAADAVELAAGRLDGDALTDLVTVNRTSGTVTVLLSTRAQPPPPPPPAPITLTATTRRAGPDHFVDLKWSGAPDSTVEILRNNARIATVANNGNYTDSLGKARGTFKYNVCSREVCSNSVIVAF